MLLEIVAKLALYAKSKNDQASSTKGNKNLFKFFRSEENMMYKGREIFMKLGELSLIKLERGNGELWNQRGMDTPGFYKTKKKKFQRFIIQNQN